MSHVSRLGYTSGKLTDVGCIIELYRIFTSLQNTDEKSSDIKQNHEPRLNMKKRSETQTLRAGCSKAERRTAKI